MDLEDLIGNQRRNNNNREIDAVPCATKISCLVSKPSAVARWVLNDLETLLRATIGNLYCSQRQMHTDNLLI